jgi:hypothetical protein
MAALVLEDGCSQIPGFILWNNTSAPMEIVLENKTIEIGIHAKNELPDNSVPKNYRQFDAVIKWKGHCYGYKIASLEALFESHSGKSGFQHVWYNLQLQEDGKFYLVNSGRQNFEVSTNQPQGFPLEPTLISEAK